MGTQLGMILATAAMSVVVARLFGPDGNGAYALLTTLFLVATAVFGVGLRAGIIYVVSGGSWEPRLAFKQSQPAALALGVGAAAAGIGFYAVASDDVLSGVSAPMAITVMASLPAGLAWIFAASVALGSDRYEKYAVLQLVQAGASVAVGVALAIPFGLLGAVIGFASSQVVAAGAGWALVVRSRDSARPGPTGPGGFSKALRFGFRAWGTEVLQFLNYRLDLFILSAFATTATVGRYSVAVSLTALGWILPNALQGVLFSRTASLDANVRGGHASLHESDQAVARAIRHLVILLAPTAIFLALLLLAGIPLLYGGLFAQSTELGFILLPGVLAVGLAKVLSMVVSGRGKPIYALYVSAATAAVTILLYIILIPALGAPGAALASTISYLLSGGLYVAILRGTTGIAPRIALVPRRSDLTDYGGAMRALRTRLKSNRERPDPRHLPG